MADFQNMRSKTVTRGDASIDAGLRSYMLRVYNTMALGLVVTALVAMATYSLAVSNEAFARAIYGSPLRFVVMFAPLIAILFLNFNIHRLSTGAARIFFFAFASLIGISFSSILLVFRMDSIAQVFFITAASFGALSLYGYTTKTDLRPIGTFLFIGLFGLILASIVHIFFMPGSEAMDFAISVAGVLIFAGLTAYDTQAIKENYYEGDDHATIGRKVIMGALGLYLDFINMFIFLLRLLGNRD